MYVNEYKKIYPTASDIAVDRQIENDFPSWFAENVSTNDTILTSLLYFFLIKRDNFIVIGKWTHTRDATQFSFILFSHGPSQKCNIMACHVCQWLQVSHF